jgi:hypothetical protein
MRYAAPANPAVTRTGLTAPLALLRNPLNVLTPASVTVIAGTPIKLEIMRLANSQLTVTLATIIWINVNPGPLITLLSYATLGGYELRQQRLQAIHALGIRLF